MDARGEAPALAEVTRRLRARFPHVDAQVVDTAVTEFHRAFDGRPIRDFVPVLVERQAADRLSAMTRGARERASL